MKFHLILFMLFVVIYSLDAQELSEFKIHNDTLSCDDFITLLQKGISQEKPYLCYNCDIELLKGINTHKDCFIGMSYYEIVSIFGNPSVSKYKETDIMKSFLFNFSFLSGCRRSFDYFGRGTYSGNSIHILFKKNTSGEIEGVINIGALIGS